MITFEGSEYQAVTGPVVRVADHIADISELDQPSITGHNNGTGRYWNGALAEWQPQDVRNSLATDQSSSGHEFAY